MGQSTSLDVGSNPPSTTPSTSSSRASTLLSNEFDFIHHQIRRHSLTLRQLTMLTYEDLQSKIKELNHLSSKFVDCNGKQLIFELKDSGEGGQAPVLLWKGLVRIRCIKINPETRGVEKCRELNLKQFLQIYNTMSQMHGTLVLDSLDSDDTTDEDQDLEDDYKKKKNCSKKDLFKEEEEEMWDTAMGDEAAAAAAGSSSNNTPVARKKRPAFNMSHSLILDELQNSGSGGAMSPTSGEECCICMEAKHEVSLPCAHSYCLACIEQWNVVHKNCPICREKLDNTDDTWVLEEKPNSQDVKMEITKSFFELTK